MNRVKILRAIIWDLASKSNLDLKKRKELSEGEK